MGERILSARPSPSERWELAARKYTPALAVAAAIMIAVWTYFPLVIPLVFAATLWGMFWSVVRQQQDLQFFERGLSGTFGKADARSKFLRGNAHMIIKYSEVVSLEWRGPSDLIVTTTKKNALKTNRLVASIPQSRWAAVTEALPSLRARLGQADPAPDIDGSSRVAERRTLGKGW
jgi:hypothetical protein